MGRHRLVGRIQVRLVAARVIDTRLSIVRDNQLRHPAKKTQRPLMGTNPIRQRLAPRGLRIGVVGRAQSRDEHLGRTRLPRRAIHDRYRLPTVVHKHPLTRFVILAHARVHRLGPFPVQIAEPAVLVP